MKKIILVLIILLVLTGGYWYSSNKSEVTLNNQPQEDQQNTTNEASTENIKPSNESEQKESEVEKIVNINKQETIDLLGLNENEELIKTSSCVGSIFKGQEDNNFFTIIYPRDIEDNPIDLAINVDYSNVKEVTRFHEVEKYIVERDGGVYKPKILSTDDWLESYPAVTDRIVSESEYAYGPGSCAPGAIYIIGTYNENNILEARKMVVRGQ